LVVSDIPFKHFDYLIELVELFFSFTLWNPTNLWALLTMCSISQIGHRNGLFPAFAGPTCCDALQCMALYTFTYWEVISFNILFYTRGNSVCHALETRAQQLRNGSGLMGLQSGTWTPTIIKINNWEGVLFFEFINEVMLIMGGTDSNPGP
jgi:hypothetical protein